MTQLIQFITTHHGITVEQGFGAVIAIVAYPGFLTGHPLEGGDHDHTVGTSRAIDSGRGGILQDINALDVVGVDVSQRAGEGDAIEHHQRVIVGIQRAGTTDANLHVGSRLGAALLHLYTGQTSLEGCGHVTGRDIPQHIPLHGGY